jgi:hypothetical protein
LIVGGGSAGHPPAGLFCFAGQGADEGTSLTRHRFKNIINNYLDRSSGFSLFFSFFSSCFVISYSDAYCVTHGINKLVKEKIKKDGLLGLYGVKEGISGRNFLGLK